MSEVDFSKYENVGDIVSDIEDIKIQGATNVAIATFEGMKLFLKNYEEKGKNYEEFYEELSRVGYTLAHARDNEPLAKNGLKFVTRMLTIRNPGLKDVSVAKKKVDELCDEFLEQIKEAKKQIVENSDEVFDDVYEVFTHCHSSTAVNTISKRAKKVSDLRVTCTETRPLYQGRETAKELVEKGINTTFIVDSAAESFIIDNCDQDTCTRPIDIVFLGSDEITMRGDAVNKIGSWGIALASYFVSKPVYVVTSILKTEIETAYRPVKIEYRDNSEIWKDAPKGLKMINPSFEIINREFITGYITEVGVVKPEDISSTIQENYQWLF